MGIALRSRAGDLFANVHQQEAIVAGHSLTCFSLAIFTAFSRTVFPFEDSSWTAVVKKALWSDGLGGGDTGTRVLCHKCCHSLWASHSVDFTSLSQQSFVGSYILKSVKASCC